MQQVYQSIESYGELSISNCRKVIFAIVALAVIIFIIYGNSFDCSWHFDDEPNITTNPNLHLKEITWEHVKRALFSDRNNPHILYRPIACLSFGLNHYFGELNVFGYHLLNIFIHLISSIFLFLFIYHTLNLPSLKTKYTTHSYSIALLSTILWAINPIQTQAITYIVQRMASLAGMFYIMSMYSYLRARKAEVRHDKILFFIFCILSFVLALGSKENAAMLPLSIFIYEILLLQKITVKNIRKNLNVFFIVTGAILIVGFIYIYIQDGNIFSFLNGYENRPFTLTQRLLTEPRIIIFYILLLLYPVPNRLSIAHSFQISTSLFNPISTVLSILFIAGAIGYAIYSAKKRPLLSFCILFFFLNHAIESTIFPLELIFEHRNYIPSMLFFVPIIIGFFYLFNYYSAKKPMQYILLSFVLFFVIGLSHSTFMRNFTWKNEKSLWIDAVEKAPNSYRPHHNLGRYYDDHGYKEEAISEYKKALEKPIYSRKNEIFVTYYNLGRIYAHIKDYKKALSFYHKALVLNSDHAPSYNNIASIMERQGKPKLAHNYLIKAIKLDPSSSEINYNLGIDYLKEGQLDRAILRLNKSATKRDQRDKVFLYLGIAYKKSGQFGRAVTYFKNALKENPRNIRPHLHLAETFYRAGDYKQAKKEVELVIDLIQDTDTFSKILHDILRNDRSSNLHPSATIIISIMKDACIKKTEALKKWSELLSQKDLWLKEEHTK